jgi:hypothetical protein
MRIRLSLVLFVLALFVAVWGVSVISGYASTIPIGGQRDLKGGQTS